MAAGAGFAIRLAIASFVFLESSSRNMTAQEDIVQAILDMRLRLDATEAALQSTRDDNVVLNNMRAQATMAGGVQPRDAPPPTPTMSSLVDTRLIGKPAVFSGTQEPWTDWSFVFKAYCSALSTRLVALMEAAQGQSDLIMPTDPADQAISSQLYYVLALSCKDRALEKLRAAPIGNGLEIWRLFCDEWEPRQRMRFTAMLTSILHTELMDPIISSLEAWERAVREYEQQSGDVVSDAIRASVLSSSIVNAKIREHLALKASRLPRLQVGSRGSREDCPGTEAMDDHRWRAHHRAHGGGRARQGQEQGQEQVQGQGQEQVEGQGQGQANAEEHIRHRRRAAGDPYLSLLPETRALGHRLQEEGQGRGQGKAASRGADGFIGAELDTPTFVGDL